MSNYVWIVEHREWRKHFMNCTMLYVASTLQIAEHLLRFSPGLDEKNCWYAIFPQVVDESGIGDATFPSEFMESDEHMVLNFYDEHYNRVRKQMEDPLPYGDSTTSNKQGAVPGAAGGECSSESVGWSGRHVSEAVAAGVDTNHQGGNEATPPADKVIPFIDWFKPIWRDFCGQS